ncbi:MAG: four helix bundle protein [Syntrophothermus sp.]
MDELRKRTLKMAVGLSIILRKKRIKILDISPVNQIIKSSSSVAANFYAATRGRSVKEFYSKICIVVEECDETLFWIEYLKYTEFVNEAEISEISSEVLQLLKIFSQMKKNASKKLIKN